MGNVRVKHIFVSYSRDDKAWVKELGKALTDRLGFSVFVDYKGIHIGVNWWRTICENIENCDYVLFIMSPMAIDSIYCTAEIDYAIALNKPILPIMLKTCLFPRKLSEKQVQYLAMNEDMTIDQILIELQKGLFDILQLTFAGEYQPPNPLPERPDEPKPKDTKSAEEVFHIAIDMMHNADFDQAILLFQNVIKADGKGKWGKLAQARLNETQSYQQVARLVNKSIRDARVLWEQHTAEYGTDFDPLGLAKKFEESKPSTQPNRGSVRRSIFIKPDPLPPIIETPPPPKVFVPPIPSFLPGPFDWCNITGGKVSLVPSEHDRKSSYLKQTTTVTVTDFFMAKYPVTNAQYQVFVNAPDGYRDPTWWDYSEGAKAWRKANPQPQNTGFPGDDHPRTNVTWYEGVAFALWLSRKLGVNIHLPTEEQWQRAAISDKGWAYPYGNTFDKNRCNFNTRGTTPVTQYPNGASPFGVMDMSGNIWEWCFTSYDKGNIPIKDSVHERIYVLRGGSWWYSSSNILRADVRIMSSPNTRDNDKGFRLACSY